MDISDKLVAIASKIRHVYDAGVFDAGFEQGKEYYKGEALENLRTEIQLEYDNMFDDMWESYSTYGETRTNYQFAFLGFPDAIFNPKEPIVPIGDGADSMFRASKIFSVDETKVDFTKATSLIDTFRGATSFTSIVVDIPNVTSMSRTFNGCNSLEKIVIKNLSADCAFDKVFTGCTVLTDLEIYGTIGQNGFNVSTCTELKKESIVNHILTNLADYSEDTGGTQWVCKLGEENIAKLNAAAIKIATDKGWVLE